MPLYNVPQLKRRYAGVSGTGETLYKAILSDPILLDDYRYLMQTHYLGQDKDFKKWAKKQKVEPTEKAKAQWADRMTKQHFHDNLSEATSGATLCELLGIPYPARVTDYFDPILSQWMPVGAILGICLNCSWPIVHDDPDCVNCAQPLARKDCRHCHHKLKSNEVGVCSKHLLEHCLI